MQVDSESTEARLAGVSAGKSVVHEFSSMPERLLGAAHAEPEGHRRQVASLPFSLLRYRYVKRGVDLLLVILALPVLLPALLVVGALVRFTSPGPVFFSHRRICRDGAFFSMWKFRTMCVNSSEVLEQYLAAPPRGARRVEQQPQAPPRPPRHSRRPSAAALQPGRASTGVECAAPAR